MLTYRVRQRCEALTHRSDYRKQCAHYARGVVVGDTDEETLHVCKRHAVKYLRKAIERIKKETGNA